MEIFAILVTYREVKITRRVGLNNVLVTFVDKLVQLNILKPV